MAPAICAWTLGLLAIFTSFVHGVDVDNCDDFALVAESLEDNDVVATVANDIVCESWTTVVVPEGRQLEIEGADSTRRVKFSNLRFEVVERDDDGEADLIFSSDMKFFATIEGDSTFGIQDVDGGVLNVGSGATVTFAGFSVCRGVSIVSARAIDTDGSRLDFADHVVNGGCWYNQGTIEIAGLAKFRENDNSGGGESFPGDGGAVYNGESGTINFMGGFWAKENRCIDDNGGTGGAMYNLGTVLIKESAVFANNIAESSGAIFNGEGAVIDFDTEETISFFNNRFGVDTDTGGNIFNRGSISFSSFVKVLRGRDGLVTSGHVSFQDGALFKNMEDGAISVLLGATFDNLSDVEFKSNEAGFQGCEDISFLIEGGGWTCGP